MTKQQRHGPPSQAFPGDIEPLGELTETSAEGRRQLKLDLEQEEEWAARLRNLQLCISDLLYENQRLRELLMSTTNYQCSEPTHEYDQNLARNRP